MKIGLSSACFYPEVLTELAIRKMKEMGFNCGEIFLNTFSEFEEDFIYKVRSEKEAREFDIISVHAFSSSFEPFLFDRYERRRKDAKKYFSMVCRAAKLLGAKYYTFHGMKLIDLSSADMKNILDVYNELAYIACDNGIKLSQENVSYCMSGNINFLNEMKSSIKYPMCFTLDIKQAYKAGTSPLNYIRVMGNMLQNIHINDRDKDNVCLLPGKGTVDYAELFMYLRHIGYVGDCIIEIYRENYSSEQDITDSKNYLEKINF